MMVVSRGFTLIEVVIAMAIIALVVTQLSAAIQHNHYTRGRLEQKTLAHTLVMNRITELQVSDPPAVGSQDVDAELAGQKWVVNTTTKLAQPNVLQIDVGVSLKVDKSEPLLLDRVRMLKVQNAFWQPVNTSSAEETADDTADDENE
jgi:general secretion pathway protein I